MKYYKIFLSIGLLILMLSLTNSPAKAQDKQADPCLAGNCQLGSVDGEKPLIAPNKKTIFRRVLVHPGAFYYDKPGGEPIGLIPTFTVLYVYYVEKREDGFYWMRCAPNSYGRDVKWVNGELTSEWNQALVLLFADRTKRKPLIFFRTQEDLISVADSSNVGEALAELRERFEIYFNEGRKPPDSFPVVSVEPGDIDGAIPEDRFYLMPIFQYDDEYYQETMLLEVGSVDSGVSTKAEEVTQGQLKPNLGNQEKISAGLADRLRGSVGQSTGAISSASVTIIKGDINVDNLAARISESINKPSGQIMTTATSSKKKPKIKTGVVILMDTTISMKPFIDECKNVTNRLYNKISKSEHAEDVYFGIVAYRSSTQGRPGVEYVTRVISDLEPVSQRNRIENSLGKLQEARVSTHSFSEDSLAGVLTVVDELSWDDSFGAKIVILMTDAGPLPDDDPKRSAKEYTPISMAALLKAKGIDLVVFHIKSPPGAADHASAENAYTRLTKNNKIAADSYYSVKTGNYQTGSIGFSQAVTEIGEYLVDAIDQAYETDRKKTDSAINKPNTAEDAYKDVTEEGKSEVIGKPDTGLQDPVDPNKGGPIRQDDRPGPEDVNRGSGTEAANQGDEKLKIEDVPVNEEGIPKFVEAPTHFEKTGDPVIDDFTQKGAEIGSALGYSILLRYLGILGEARAPSVVRSWIADKDLTLITKEEDAEEVETIQVAVLMTKNQLSAMLEQLNQVLETAEVSLNTQSEDFFKQLISLSAIVSNDPQQLSVNSTLTIGQMGVLEEFLNDLPYTSTIMKITEANWRSMSQFQQDEIVRTIRSLVKIYRDYGDDIDHWAKFSGEENEGDWLYRVPLSVLP
jgi:hypothetical protein